MKIKAKLTVVLLLGICNLVAGQSINYKYQRELSEITDTWHSITLPDDLFGHIKDDFSDIRIIGITENLDTVEAPYLIEIVQDKIIKNKVDFDILNRVRKNRGFYFTFDVPSADPINEIKLNFKNSNYDWRVALEGSHDQKDWYGIVNNYRILAIDNNLTKYTFNTLRFNNVKYSYLRLFVPTRTKPTLRSAELTEYITTNGDSRSHEIESVNVRYDKNSKLSIIDIELPMKVPVSNLKINVKDTFDFYRPIAIKYLVDSVKTPKRWVFNYRSLSTGMLSSLEENSFHFQNTLTNKLKVIITNHDNTPLSFEKFFVNGNTHKLIVRITEPGKYYLMYGNPNAVRPSYDIGVFENQIPKPLQQLTLEGQQTIATKPERNINPLIENKAWLWSILVIIMGVMGWFSLRILRKS